MSLEGVWSEAISVLQRGNQKMWCPRLSPTALGLRAGELLKQIEPATPGPKPEIGTAARTEFERQEAGARAGMSRHQQVQAVRVANIPEPEFEQQVESDRPSTVTALVERGKGSGRSPGLCSTSS